MNSPTSAIRKAAVLIASLDRHTADNLIDQMSVAQAQRVRDAIMDLGPIDPDEQNQVIEEFFRIGPFGQANSASASAQYSAQRRPLPAEDSMVTYEPSSAEPTREPNLDFLRNVSGVSLAAFLQNEHPQTIALVASRLPADHAAELLACLPGEMQGDVARRLVDLDETDPQVLAEIEQALRQQLGEQDRKHRRRATGLATLGQIVAAADQQSKQGILHNLARHDRQLATKLGHARREPIAFADLMQLDDAALTLVLEGIDAEVLRLALVGATTGLVTRVLGMLAPDQAAALRYGLDRPGPLRLSDLEVAQRRVAARADELERHGQISRRGVRKLSLAA